jgi:hypothetical protein
MPHNYHGLPAAANVEQAIVLAQLLILRDLERRAQSGGDISASARVGEQSTRLTTTN